MGWRKHTNFNISTGVEENVVALDVTVNDVLAVEMGKPFACLHVCVSLLRVNWKVIFYLITDGGDLRFGDMIVVIDDIGQRPTFHEFHHNP